MIRPRNTAIAVVVAAWSLAFAGCGSGLTYAPVEGLVTHDGKPLEGLRIVFEPVGGGPGSGSVGVTDSQGRYTLTRLEGGEPGARVAMHRITVVASFNPEANEATPQRRDPLPQRLRDGSVRVEVPEGGTANADFAVEEYR